MERTCLVNAVLIFVLSNSSSDKACEVKILTGKVINDWNYPYEY